MHRALLVAFVLFAGQASAFQPRTGQWWNPAESGRGFNIEIQNGVMTLTVYTYDAAGNAQWYLASGAMTGAQHSFSGALNKYVGGQCAACSYQPATLAGNDGTVTVNFTSEIAATVSLPGGHVSAIRPLNFAYGDPPQGLLGEWVYVYDIISTFADRFDYTVVRGATANGTGTVWDDSRDAACEFQVSGALGGMVACFQFNSAGGIVNSYLYNYGIDETFSGQWVSISPAAAFAMKGFRIKGTSGFAKFATTAPDGLPTKALQATATASSAAPAPESAEMEKLAAAMRATRR